MIFVVEPDDVRSERGFMFKVEWSQGKRSGKPSRLVDPFFHRDGREVVELNLSPVLGHNLHGHVVSSREHRSENSVALLDSPDDRGDRVEIEGTQ